MGILGKAAVSSIVVGLGALAVSKNQKQIKKFTKSLSVAAHDVLGNGHSKTNKRKKTKHS